MDATPYSLLKDCGNCIVPVTAEWPMKAAIIRGQRVLPGRLVLHANELFGKNLDPYLKHLGIKGVRPLQQSVYVHQHHHPYASRIAVSKPDDVVIGHIATPEKPYRIMLEQAFFDQREEEREFWFFFMCALWAYLTVNSTYEQTRLQLRKNHIRRFRYKHATAIDLTLLAPIYHRACCTLLKSKLTQREMYEVIREKFYQHCAIIENGFENIPNVSISIILEILTWSYIFFQDPIPELLGDDPESISNSAKIHYLWCHKALQILSHRDPDKIPGGWESLTPAMNYLGQCNQFLCKCPINPP